MAPHFLYLEMHQTAKTRFSGDSSFQNLIFQLKKDIIIQTFLILHLEVHVINLSLVEAIYQNSSYFSFKDVSINIPETFS